MFSSHFLHGFTACLLTASLLITNVTLKAQAPVKQWDKTIGGNGAEFSYGLQPSRDGGYVTGGSSDSGIQGDKTQVSRGKLDYWLVKMDANGNKLWDKAYGGEQDDYMRVLLSTPDGGYLLGGFSYSSNTGEKSRASIGRGSDFWLVRVDANGNKLWDRTIGGTGEDQLYAMGAANDGGYLLGGLSSSDIGGDRTAPYKGSSYWVVRIDASGNKLWDKGFGGDGMNYIRVIQPTSDGGWLVGGESVYATSIPDKTDPPFGGSDIWLLRLDANGNKVWDKTFGGTNLDLLFGIQPTKDGNFLLSGFSTSGVSGNRTQASQGGGDYWVIKIDPTGNKLWDKAFGSSSEDASYSLVPTSDGNYLLGGHSSSPAAGDKSQASQGDYDYWVVKIDPEGNKLWDVSVGGSGRDLQTGLLPTSDGGFIVSGTSSSALSGDKTQSNWDGSSDYWLVKMVPVSTPSMCSVVQVYPNPANTHLTICLPASLPQADLSVVMFDAIGRTILRKPVLVSPQNIIELEVGQHAAGMYIVRLESPTTTLATQRVILQ